MSQPTYRSVTLDSGAKEIFRHEGRYFLCIAATGTFTVSFDGGPAIPFVAQRRLGSPTGQDFSRLVITNTSGGSNTIEFYIGGEALEISDGASMSLSAASILSITPAAVTHTGDVVLVSNTTATFAGKKSLSVLNTGATPITVDYGSGARTFAPGAGDEKTVFRVQDSLPSIAVDTTGGGEATVSWLA